MKKIVRRFGPVTTLAAAVLFTSGCLVKEASHTITLEPDGSGAWSVIEHRIHAVADTPADRLREEEEFLTAARSNMHPVANALRALGAIDVTSRLISERWPYAVTTEGRFQDIAAVLQAALDSCGDLTAQSVLERRPDRVTWRIVVHYDPSASDDGEATDPRQRAATDIFSDTDAKGPIFFIRHGRFVDGVGFTIADDGRVATLDDLSERDWDKQPHLELSLSWIPVESAKQPATP